MVINWELQELHVKLVYCGPPLGGKTTNMVQIHGRIPEQQRSELISVKTRRDHLSADFMQLELNIIKGLQPKFKLLTIPGQASYHAIRKTMLRDVDGIVFVADSSIDRLAVNRWAIQDMWQHLEELGRSPKNIPFVLQCNKQDLSDAVQPTLLARFLGLETIPNIPAIATEGKGTCETLKNLISQVLQRL